MSGKEILEELKQEDYEFWIRTGKSFLSEEQWDYVIRNFVQKRDEYLRNQRKRKDNYKR